MPPVAKTTADFFDDVLSVAGFGEPEPTVAMPAADSHARPHSFDPIALLNANGVRVHSTKQDALGTKYLLAECPFDPNHKAPDSYVTMSDKGIIFHCSHNSCEGFKWQDVRRKFDPTAYDKTHQASRGNAVQSSEPEPSKPITYQRITAAELDVGDYRTDFLIDGTLVAGQPLIVAGGKKCLKTNNILDAAISLATMTPMLGALKVNRACRVLVMSGESGLATIQETCRRICLAKSKAEVDAGRAAFMLKDVLDLIFSPDLPRIGDIRCLDALEKMIVGDKIDALFVDPAYLCMDLDGREGSLFASGPQLKGLSKVCENNGVTLGLCHHTKKGVVDPFAPPELEDIAWAGFQEFARQWWLLGRRERFDPDSDGVHKLWLNIGGSAGFASLWAVDIVEGKYPAPRRWEVTVSHAAEAREQAVEQQQAAKAEVKGKKHQATVEAAKGRIADALRSVDGNQDTKRNIRERAGMKGVAYDEAFAYLLRSGKMIEVEIERANGRKYEGFKYAF